MSYEVSHLMDQRWAVRPFGCVGTSGFYPFPWTVVYVTASNAEEAMKKARVEIIRQKMGLS